MRARRGGAGLRGALGLICLLVFGAHAADAVPSWKEVDRLASEQKFEAAAEVVVKLREQARKAGDEEAWARALVREAELRAGLGGFEAAVRLLQDEPWPNGPLPRAALRLFRAWALVQYASAYDYEIRQRERVAVTTGGDLTAWTFDQIFAAAVADYAAIWAGREALGREPLAKLGDFLEPNSYPSDVRGTLRDATAYLFVALLANTEGWRPEQSHEESGLDLRALLAGDPARSRLVKLDDPAVHPLVKIAAVLDDLEAWHLQRGERDAALETRLERARRLHSSFAEDADRDLIVQDLERRLPAFADRPWWAAGQATLAELTEGRGDLARARDVARAGEKAFPTAPGGVLCRSIAARLERPDFQLASARADALGRRSIEVSHRNLPTVYFRAYALDLEARLRAVGVEPLPASEELQRLLRGKPAREWSVSLPATPDLADHKTYVTPPLDKLGLYAIVASARRDFKPSGNKLLAVPFVATDLVLVDRYQPDGVEAEVLDGATGRPVPGAEVVLYRADYRRAHTVEARGKTGADGIARLSVKAKQRSFFLVARHGGTFALDPTLWFSSFTPFERGTDAFVYTDRSIYRPLQKLYFKAIVYNGKAKEARYHVVADQAVTVFLKDANGEDVDKRVLRTNAFGSVAGEMTIPAGRLLGEWRLETDLGGGAAVRVEEYKRPTFEVKLQDPRQALRLNKPAVVEGEARYYFGLPVASGQVHWRVTREPMFPLWWSWLWGGEDETAPHTVASGTAAVDAGGHFRVAFTPKEDERQASRPEGRSVSYRYQITADVTEEAGETRSADRSFRLGYVTVEARLEVGTGFLREGAPASVRATRTDLDGVPRAGAARWRLVALAQPPAPVMPADEPPGRPAEPHRITTPGDKLRPRWDATLDTQRTLAAWPDGAAVAQGALVHDAKGEARVPLPKLPPGAYRLRYETSDDFGARFETSTELLVVGERTPVALPAVMAVEQTTVAVGGTLRIFAGSGFSDQPVTVDVWRSRARVVRRRLVAGRDKPIVELPVTAADRGGLVVTLQAVRDHQLMRQSVPVQVPWDDRQLSVEIATFRDKLRPGAKETWKLTVRGPPGAKPEAAAAELLAYMYDRSLDLFAPHAPADPMTIWPNRQHVPDTQSSGGPASLEWLDSEDWGRVPTAPELHGDRLRIDRGHPNGRPGPWKPEVYYDSPPAEVSANAEPVPEWLTRRGALDKRLAQEKPKLARQFALRGNDADGVADAVVKSEAGGSRPANAPPRINFSETAFWRPQLLTGPDGSASVEFTVPDSVTSWTVWVHAVTKELASGSTHKETRSVKELMVRPSLPRFLREGDRAALKVVVNNASPGPLAGQVRLEVVDPDSGQDLAAEFGLGSSDRVRPFQAGKDGESDVTFPIAAPRRARLAAFKVTAVAGAFSDGEIRPLPVLPSRVHLVQSRFVTLHDKARREMEFKDLTVPDATRVDDQMVVSVDAQLFTTVLRALPYLVTYPYECSEQTLNRFLSAAIVTSAFRDNPTVARLGKALSQRDTPLETFDAADPNRKMTLEESPWLEEAHGEPLDKGAKSGLVKVLDPRIANAERAASLAKLTKAQTGSGGFSWFPGGAPDPYMTLYIMYGFAKAAEFKVDVPKDVVRRGWTYLGGEFRQHDAVKLRKRDCCWEWLTFLNYVASSYPDASWTAGGGLTRAERKEILDFSFKHWKQQSRYLKALLALTLKRAGRAKDANLVWASVMDGAKLRPDEGLSFAPEDRSWLWYEDTIETEAFALRALMELEPDGPRKKESADGLVLWLLLHKKLNQWKSTRATAEVIYALVHYFKHEGTLGIRESARVTVGDKTTDLVFEPDAAVTNGRIVIPGPEVSAKTATVTVEKDTQGFALASATWHFSTEKLPAEERGDFFSVSRRYFRRDHNGKEFTLTPLAEGAAVKPGDEVEVQLSLRSKHAAEYVHLRDPRAAGFEPEATTSHYNRGTDLSWYEETRDSGANFFFEQLPAGEHTFKYRVRASMAGRFRVGPATVESMYAPEFNASSRGAILEVAPAR